MPKVELTCEECGSRYTRWPSQVDGSRFCSRPCLNLFLDREVRSKHRAPWLRALNRKAGRNAAVAKRTAAKRSKTRRQRRPGKYSQHRGKADHRRIAERIANRKLKSDEFVHHIDGDSSNNKEENLCIGITRSEHNRIHAYLRRERRIKVFSMKRRGIRYRFRTRPYRHQVRALKKIIMKRGGGLFMEMGTGKTKVAIDFGCAMNEKLGVTKIQVICPKSVVPVWQLEIQKHQPHRFDDKIEWRTINYDKVADKTFDIFDEEGDVVDEMIKPGAVHELMDWAPDIVIADEAHKIKNHTSKRTRALIKLGDETPYKLILTGTPVTKSPLDLYAQFKFLRPEVFGTRFANYKRKYCVMGGYGGKQIQRFINLKDLKRRVSPYIFQIKKEECLDLPARTHQILHVNLEENARRIYEDMARESVATFEGEAVEAPIVLTKLLRLSQFTSGHFKVDDGYKRISKAKYQACLDQLVSLREQDRDKVVIFCRFKAELKDAAIAAKKAGYKVLLFHGKTSSKDRELKLLKFDETKRPTAFIAQIATGSLGISLTAASEAIFYSHTYDYAEFVQACDRLHRIGQHHPVTYYHLLVKDSVDEAVWLALKTKKNIADLVLRRPELLMKEGYDE